MDSRQKQLINEVYVALDAPAQSLYIGMPFSQVTALLAGKLKEVLDIENELQNQTTVQS